MLSVLGHRAQALDKLMRELWVFAEKLQDDAASKELKALLAKVARTYPDLAEERGAVVTMFPKPKPRK